MCETNSTEIQQSKLDRILTAVENLQIDDSIVRGQVICDETVNWYAKRFDMFHEDGTMQCIGIYLEKAMRDSSINDITRIAIMHEALNRQLAK